MSLPPISLFNVKGAHDSLSFPHKFSTLLLTLRTTNSDYAFLTKTHSHTDKNPFSCLSSPPAQSFAPSTHWTGVAIIPLAPHAYIDSVQSDSDGRFLTARIRTWDGKMIPVCLLYAPPNKQSRID